jgi:hypothetical protein
MLSPNASIAILDTPVFANVDVWVAVTLTPVWVEITQ